MQNHKIALIDGNEKIRTEVADGWSLITITACRSNINIAVQEVGIMLRKYTSSVLTDSKRSSSRILIGTSMEIFQQQ